jgi:ribonucleoside-diphosphate reductase subunit M1
MRMGLDWGSEEALKLDAKIFESIYLAANEQSVAIAEEKGSFFELHNTPLWRDKLHFDNYDGVELAYADRWSKLRLRMGHYGRRNALLVALMPTASTSTLLGCNSESFEPRSSFLYVRRVLSGEYFVLARPLVDRCF